MQTLCKCNKMVECLNFVPITILVSLTIFLSLKGEVIVNTKTITCSSGIELDYFTTKNVNLIQPDSCLYLSFRHKCLPSGILFKNCKSVIFETTYRNIFGEGIFKKLLTGQLISKP